MCRACGRESGYSCGLEDQAVDLCRSCYLKHIREFHPEMRISFALLIGSFSGEFKGVFGGQKLQVAVGVEDEHKVY